MQNELCVGAVVSFAAILIEVVISEFSKCGSFVGCSSQQVVSFKENECVGLTVSSVAGCNESEIDVLVGGGVADGFF